ARTCAGGTRAPMTGGATPDRYGGATVAGAIALGAALILWLHVTEPQLAATWSFAHLGRHPVLRWLAVLVVLALPVAGKLLWRGRSPSRAIAPLRWWHGAIAVLLLWAVLALLGLRFPAPVICIDAVYFVKETRDGTAGNHRWFLALWSYGSIYRALGGALDGKTFVRVLNALMTAVACVAVVGSARLLGRDRREALTISALVLTSFGNLQLALGYIDVYPIPQAAMALFAWTALRAVRGGGSPLWPLAIAAVGPLCYVGLLLLAPAALVLAITIALEPGGIRRLLPAVAGVVLLLGVGTLPLHGRPWDLLAFVRGVAHDAQPQLGLSETSSLLPIGYAFGVKHLTELLHGLLLTDAVGTLLLVTALPAVLWTTRDAPTWRMLLLLGALAGPVLVYAFLMDPLFGPYADWDLFSYGALASSLLGAYAFVLWARAHDAWAGPLAGLLVAAAVVHALARLNALDVDFARHMREEPFHVAVPALPGDVTPPRD
ncbi:hypothetical protein K2Z84_28990, partial [Candidatus Binatia bacterium]|nr:hypothetical protein [Candidatus Binatia bacterium]